MPKQRITLSLDSDIPCDKAILDFLAGLPRRTRSEIMKEILFDALDKTDEKPSPEILVPVMSSDPPGIDPEKIVENLF